MKTIVYTPDGLAFPDAKVEEMARNFLVDVYPNRIEVSTENFINVARVHILRGVIPNTEVEFVFEEEILRPDVDGRLPFWPRGFCDFTDSWLMELMRGRVTGRL